MEFIAGKENFHFYEKTSGVDQILKKCHTPQRTPLMDVNNQQGLNRNSKKAYYSQVTPILKTPGARRNVRMKLSTMVYKDPDKSEVDDVLLNSLVCKKVEEIISNAKRDLEKKLAEKDKIIHDLTDKIETQSYCSTFTEPQDAQTDLDEQVEIYVGNIIETCVSQLQQESKMTAHQHDVSGNNTSIHSNSSHEEHTSFSNSQKKDSLSNCRSYEEIKHQDIGCSPVKFRDTELVDSACSQKKLTYVDAVTSTTLETCDIGQQTVVDVCDACVMSRIDQANMACSPFTQRQVGQSWYTKDQSSSPLHFTSTTETETMTEHFQTPVKQSSFVQAVPEQVSVMCSPFSIVYRETGVMAVPDVYDSCTTMEQIRSVDTGVSVKPETQDVQTMTEMLVKTSETAMTPVKCVNKQGRRLTAEEVRKQHPRALANQLDTMSLTVQRLQKDVYSVEKDRDQNRSKVTELKNKLKEKQKMIDEEDKKNEEAKQEIRENYERHIKELEETIASKDSRLLLQETEVEALQNRLTETARTTKLEMEVLADKCESLLADLQSQKNSYEQQINELKQEVERRDCSHQLKTAHTLIRELQGELSEYSELSESLALAEQLQAEIHEVVADNYKKVKDAADRLMTLKNETDNQRSEVMAHKASNEAASESLKAEKKEIQEECEEMRTKLQSSTTSMVQMEGLYKSTAADLLSATNQVQILSSELFQTKKAYEDCLLSKTALLVRVEDQEEDSKVAFLEIQGLQASLKLQDQELERVHRQLNEVQEKHQKQQEQLQGDKDHFKLLATNLQRTLDSREEDISLLEKEMYEIRECMVQQMENMDDLVAKSKANAEDYNTCLTENMELRDRCAIMQSSIQELKERLHTNEFELSDTKKQATEMLEKQEEEMQQCAQWTHELVTKISKLLTNLRNKVGMDNEQDSQEGQSIQKNVKRKLNVGEKSFLSQIFKAAKCGSVHKYQTIEKCEGSPVSYLDNSEENLTGVYLLPPSDTDSNETSLAIANESDSSISPSAFAPVQAGSSGVVNPQSGPLIVAQGKPFSNAQAGLQADSQSNQTDCCTEDDNNSSSLVNQLQLVDEYFSEVIRLANIIEKASRLSIEDLKGENDEVVYQMKQMKVMNKDLESEVQGKLQELLLCRETIASLESRLDNMNDTLSKFCDQEITITGQKNELHQLKNKVRSLEGEKEVLRNEIMELSGKSEKNNDTKGTGMEVLNLKMKIQNLKDHLMKKDDHYEELSNKASKRMRTLEDNWKKADAEVQKFDELVNFIHKTLSKREDLLSKNEDLRNVLMVINGLEPLPSEERVQPLKSIKTAKW